MISVLIIWLYMILTTGLAGLLIMALCRNVTGYVPRDAVAPALAGIAAVTVYAQVWSLFGGVGPAADICMCICLVLAGIYYRRDTGEILSDIIRDLKSDRLPVIVSILLMIVMAYGASHGLMHYDTGLYHAQAIRWIEEYGSVPGLTNLHTRLGYNSSAFCFNALYSFAFTGRSYHVTGAFCALLLAWECAYRPLKERGGLLCASGMARIMGIYYLLIIFDEMVSPASDYYMVCLGFILVIRWMDSVEMYKSETGRDEALARMSMLAVFTAFILTVKLSGAVFVLLACFPGYVLLREHRGREFAFCVGAGGVTVLPYLTRNIILSGWLLYPSTAFGFFDTGWRVPRDTASYDYKEIQVYGRGYTDVSRYDESITRWFGDWYAQMSLTDRLLILAAIVGVAYFVIKCIYYVCRGLKHHESPCLTPEMFPEAVLCIGFVFWLLTSPLMRYGCLYVYLCDALLWGGVIGRIPADRRTVRFAVSALLMFLCVYKGIMFAAETARAYRSDTWIMQQDYETFDVHAYELRGDGAHITVYAPDEGDRTGYDPFPSSPWDMSDTVMLRGSDIRAGFKPTE